VIAKQLFDQGKLDEAVAAALEDVRARPRDHGARLCLSDLLCFAGELERADKQLDALATLDPKASLPVALGRQIIRGEIARQDFYRIGRVPEFIGEVSPDLRQRLQASILLREGNAAEAGRLLATAEAAREPQKGTCDGHRFEALRDLDDLTASVLEVVTSTGKYFWIGLEQIVRLEFAPPKTVRDLIWRQAELEVHKGPEGVVYIPVMYPGSAQHPDGAVRLGRMTVWQESDEAAPVRGQGQRTWLIDDEERGILELTSVEFGAGQA
jgi:type VI secretion system protein ImpE